jgi:two-component system, LytTR family, response regulator
MLKAVIVDDELNSCEMLEWQLKEFCTDVQIAAIINSPEVAAKKIQELKPDLVFLDIEMPKINGFELLKQIGTVDFDIIFTTAYDQYAIKAMKYSAVDYLLKPIEKGELQAAVEKVAARRGHNSREQIQFLIQQIDALKRNQKIRRIAVSTSESFTFLDLDEIVCCESESNYTYIHLVDKGRILISKTLKLIEDILDKDQFVRVSQSYLVNLNHVKKYVREDGGYLLMSNGMTITVSKNKKDDLFEHFPKF